MKAIEKKYAIFSSKFLNAKGKFSTRNMYIRIKFINIFSYL